MKSPIRNTTKKDSITSIFGNILTPLAGLRDIIAINKLTKTIRELYGSPKTLLKM